MAINDNVDGLEVQIVLIDGTVLDEHDDPNIRDVDTRITTVRYIESASHLQFYISIDYGPRFTFKTHHIREMIILDEKAVCESHIHSTSLKDGHSSTYKKGNKRLYRGDEFFFRPVVVSAFQIVSICLSSSRANPKCCS